MDVMLLLDTRNCSMSAKLLQIFRFGNDLKDQESTNFHTVHKGNIHFVHVTPSGSRILLALRWRPCRTSTCHEHTILISSPKCFKWGTNAGTNTHRIEWRGSLRKPRKKKIADDSHQDLKLSRCHGCSNIWRVERKFFQRLYLHSKNIRCVRQPAWM